MTFLPMDLQLALGISLSVFLDIVWGEQVELVRVAVGLLCNVTAEFLIILRNVRTHWKPLGLTVQGLINFRPCFLGCLICNFWSLIFLSLLKNSFCSFVDVEDVAWATDLWRGSGRRLSPTPGPYVGAGGL